MLILLVMKTYAVFFDMLWILIIMATYSNKVLAFSAMSFMVNGNISMDSLPATEFVQQETPTVFSEDGSVRFSDETIRLLTDSAYRLQTYPELYQMSQVPDLLEERRTVMALWTLINVYSQSPEQTRTIVFMLAERGIRGRHYLDAFYTYAFADPEIFHLGGGDLTYLADPLKMEEKLHNCRSLAAYTEKYLKTRNPGN